MADLLREQSSLNIGLSNISDELAIRKKASRRARIYAHIDNAKKELKEEREKCIREFREEVRFTHVVFILLFSRELKQTKTTARTETSMSKTIAVHVRYKSLYISLPSSAKQQREMTKFCVV